MTKSNNFDEKLREILCSICEFKHLPDICEKDKCRPEAITAIKKLIAEGIGEEEKIPEVKRSFQSLFPGEIAELLTQRHTIIGYNQAKAEIRKRLGLENGDG